MKNNDNIITGINPIVTESLKDLVGYINVDSDTIYRSIIEHILKSDDNMAILQGDHKYIFKWDNTDGNISCTVFFFKNDVMLNDEIDDD